MKLQKNIKLTIILTLAGTIFTGYMSGTKFFSSTCPFNEPCSTFFGISTCYIGLALFLAMFIISVVAFFVRRKCLKLAIANTTIAGLGIILATHYTWLDLNQFLAGKGISYTLLLPICAYGLFFFIITFIVSWKWWSSCKPDKI